MALVTLREITEDAYKHGYAVGAFNIVSLEFLNAIFEAAEALRSPIICNIAEVHFPYIHLEQIAPAIRHMAQQAAIPVALNLDHGESLETAVRAIRCGFTGVMVDFSSLSHEENITQTSMAVRLAHSVGVSVEGEIGHVGGAEGGAGYDDGGVLTDPDQAAEYVKRTGVDCLAISIGNVHGLYKGKAHIDFDLLHAIRRKVSTPLVLHGSTGVSDEDIRKAISMGISKINYFTGMTRHATRHVRHLLHKRRNMPGFEELLMAGREGIKTKVRERIAVYGSRNACGRTFRTGEGRITGCHPQSSRLDAPAAHPSQPDKEFTEEEIAEIVTEVTNRVLKETV